MNWLKVLLEFFTSTANAGTTIVPGRPAISLPKGVRRLNPDDLRTRLQAIVTEPEYQPHPSPDNPKETETHCNFFVRAVSHWYGYKAFDQMGAKAICAYMGEHRAEWRLIAGPGVEYTEAISEAAQGSLVIAGWDNPGGKHGHVAIIAPETPGERSDSWRKVVPFVANVGLKNWYGRRLSQAFIKEPLTYLYLGQ